jgi:hypothetical protein
MCVRPKSLSLRDHVAEAVVFTSATRDPRITPETLNFGHRALHSRGPRHAPWLRVLGWKPGSPARAVVARAGVEAGVPGTRRGCARWGGRCRARQRHSEIILFWYGNSDRFRFASSGGAAAAICGGSHFHRAAGAFSCTTNVFSAACEHSASAFKGGSLCRSID